MAPPHPAAPAGSAHVAPRLQRIGSRSVWRERLLEGWRDVDTGDLEAAPVTLGQVHVSSSQLWASPTALPQTTHSTGPSGCTRLFRLQVCPPGPAGAAEGRHGVPWIVGVAVSSGQAHSLVSSFTRSPTPEEWVSVTGATGQP